ASSGNDADFNFLNPNDLENSDFSFPSKNLSFFVENLFYIGKKLTLNVGGRFEYISSASSGFYKNYAVHPINLDTIAINTLYSETESTRKVPLVGIGSSYKISKNSSIYTNFCMNYRAINFNDIRINNPNIIVDTAMNDEKGFTAELGWRGFLNKYFYVDAAAFYILYGDKIGLAPSGVKKVRTNIGDAINQGVEFFTEFDFWKLIVSDSSKIGASLFLNCAYVDAKYVRSREPNYIGNQVEYVAPFIGRFGLKFRGEKWQTQVQFSFTDKQFADASNAIDPSGDAVIGQIPSYSVLDWSFRYSFKYGIQTELGINNVLNESYYTRRATAYPGPGILPADGRFFYLSLQYRFESKK
ncbi:MAG: TonB-dependent receptor domain-containing protein, partial [Fluviicola sp.]